MITIITPIFFRNREEYLYERAKKFICTEPTIGGIHRMFVDFGSPSFIIDEMAVLCEGHGHRFIRMNRNGEPFSIGACRNVGVQHATTEFISFQDIDLAAPTSFYERLAQKMRCAPPFFNHVECIPVLYLTEDATREYELQDRHIAHTAALNYFHESTANKIHMYAPASSAIIVRRDFYLSMGGVREEFFGHGYEDFEMMNRLTSKANLFLRSQDYYSHDHKYGSLEYKGYRTFFSMFGRENMANGLFCVHLYHPVPESPGYGGRSALNRKLFENFMRALDKTGELPAALSVRGSETTTLALMSRTAIPMKSIRMAVPYLGNVTYVEEKNFTTPHALLDYVQHHAVTRVLFLTPYANEHRLSLYRACRSSNIPYTVFDRGALPDAWFFDPHGFNADSASYHPCMWDKALKTEQRESIELYVHALISSEAALEDNGQRAGAEAVLRKYVPYGKKMLFVPLQRPNDSVIRHFAGTAESLENFCFVVSQLSLRLGAQWQIVVKKHPLEKTAPVIPGVVFTDESTHVNDLLSASSAVLVINSGVGLLSTLFGKPTFNMGLAFYCHEGLSVQVTSAADAAEKILAAAPPSREKVLRFAHYLVNHFYSFAKTTYRQVSDGDASRSVATHLDFTTLRLPCRNAQTFIMREQILKKSSPRYDFYRQYIAGMGKKPADPPSNMPIIVPPPAKSSASAAPMDIPAPAVPMVMKKNTGDFARKLKKLKKQPHRFFADLLLKRSVR